MREDEQVWTTTAGNFATFGTCKVNFKLPELDRHAHISTNVHVTNKDMNYDMIIGRDLLRKLHYDGSANGTI